MKWWPEPSAGEIIWCYFPNSIQPKPKPRPALILMIKSDENGLIFVQVAYGTSQKLNRLYPGEFRITKEDNPAAYSSAGLSYNTKFNLRSVIELPFNDLYFNVPPHAPHGQNPKLGVLHPTMVKIASAAYLSIKG